MSDQELIKFSIPKNLSGDMESRVKVFASNFREFGKLLQSLGHKDIVDTYIEMGINMICLKTGVGILDEEHAIGVNTSVQLGKEEIDVYMKYFPGFKPYIDTLDKAIADFTA